MAPINGDVKTAKAPVQALLLPDLFNVNGGVRVEGPFVLGQTPASARFLAALKDTGVLEGIDKAVTERLNAAGEKLLATGSFKEAAALHKTIEALRDEHVALEAGKSTPRKEALEKKLKVWAKAQTASNEAVTATEQESDALNEQLRKLTGEAETVDMEISSKRKIKEGAVSSVEKLDVEIKLKESEVEQLKAGIREIEAEIAKVKGDASKPPVAEKAEFSDAELEFFKGDEAAFNAIKTAQEKKRASDARMRQLEADQKVAKLESDKAEVETTIKMKSGEIDELRLQRTAISNENLAVIDADLGSLTKTRGRLQAKYDELNGLSRAASARLVESIQEAQKVSQTLEEITARMAALPNVVDAELQAAIGKLDELKQKLSDAFVGKVVKPIVDVVIPEFAARVKQVLDSAIGGNATGETKGPAEAANAAGTGGSPAAAA